MATESRIARNALKGETFTLTVGCWNIANARRDEEYTPLSTRIRKIADHLLKHPEIDVMVLLEANRPSGGRSFTSFAAEIEDVTGLRYIGVKYLNATENSFGKAVFVRPNKIFVSAFDQIPTGESEVHPLRESTVRDYTVATGNYFGNDIVIVKAHPVADDNRIIRDKSVSVGIVHFPMGREDRLQVSRWISDVHNNHVDVWMGDWNTFPDDGGDEMIGIITEKYPMVPKTKDFTFRAFPHDLIRKPIDFVIPDGSEVVREDEESKMVRFRSCLDHVFVNPTFNDSVGEAVVSDLVDASDHALITVEVVI